MTFLFAIGNYFLRAYLWLCLWTWAAVDILHWRSFSYWQVLLFWICVSEFTATRSFKKTTKEEDEYQLSMMLGTNCLALLFAYLAHRLATA